MIIDQLPLLSGNVIATDEIPVERGTTTYKTTPEKFLAAMPKDATPTEGSTNAVESGGVYDALQTLITANGILKGNGSAVSAATKGTDYGALSFAVTLTSTSWSDNVQNVSNVNFNEFGFAYMVSPASASFAAYGESQIYADDVTTNGVMTFHCDSAPSADLIVNIVRVVSA